MRYIIHYDIASLFVLVTVMIHYYYKRSISTKLNKIFEALIVCAFISNVTDICTIVTISNPGLIPHWLDTILNSVYLITFNATSVIYFSYIILLTNDAKLSKVNHWRTMVPFMAVMLLVLTSPFTKTVFYYNENGEYTHGPLFMVLYISAFYYVGSSLIQALWYRKKMTRGQVVSVLFFTLSSLGSIGLQIIYKDLLIVQFMVSISITMIYLNLENPEDYISKRLGIYNHLGFVELFQRKIHQNREFSVLGIKIDGSKYINENLGVEAGNKILKNISDFLVELTGNRVVFHLSGFSFIMMAEYDRDKWDLVTRKIEERFQEPFVYKGLELSLTEKMCLFDCPSTVTSVEDAIDILEYALETGNVQSKESGNLILADKEMLEKGKRETRILQLLKKSVREDGLEVFYQPIYSVKEKKYTTAEALVRLKKSDLGFISPEEFIPIAEKNGLILTIGEVVLGKVCSFYKENELEKYGISHIHVNLSVVECMQEHLYERFLKTMEKYDLPPGRISLEITETAAVVSKEVLKENMNKLVEKGIRFSMDDYGTGFSNTSTIINYPFAEIKIDKSMVWSAMENERAMIALKNSIHMIKELSFELVAEGVENKEQADQLEEMGCDYFQGYYYSKPVNESCFMELLGYRLEKTDD